MLTDAFLVGVALPLVLYVALPALWFIPAILIHAVLGRPERLEKPLKTVETWFYTTLFRPMEERVLEPTLFRFGRFLHREIEPNLEEYLGAFAFLPLLGWAAECTLTALALRWWLPSLLAAACDIAAVAIRLGWLAASLFTISVSISERFNTFKSRTGKVARAVAAVTVPIFLIRTLLLLAELMVQCTGFLIRLVIWPLASVFFVAVTWVGSATPNRAEGSGSPADLRHLVRGGDTRALLRRLALGGDTRALQVCILAFVARAIWGWTAEIVRLSNSIVVLSLIEPVMGLTIQMALMLSMGPFKDSIITQFRLHWPQAEVASIASLLGLPCTHRPLMVTGALLAMAWGNTPWLLSKCFPLLRLVFRGYRALSTLQAVSIGDNDELREWQWYWLLNSLLTPTLRALLPIPALLKATLVFSFNIFLLVDRGNHIPCARRAVLAVKLYLRGLPESVLDGDTTAFRTFDRQMIEAWRLAGLTRQEGGSASARARFRRMVSTAHAQAISSRSGGESGPGTAAGFASATAGAPATSSSDSADGHGVGVAECVVCCCEISKGETRALCPRQHPTCSSCFDTLFDMCLSRTMTDLAQNEMDESRYMVKCQTDCEYHFGLKETTKMMSEEQAVRWDNINKKLYRDLNLDEWVRKRATRDAEAERVESIRGAFRDGSGKYVDVFQCPNCTYGPKNFFACTDLTYHHGQQTGRDPRTGEAIRIDNSCDRCGFFSPAVRMWDRWDGTVFPEDQDGVLGSKISRLCEERIAQKAQQPPKLWEQSLLETGLTLEALRSCPIAPRQEEMGHGTFTVKMLARPVGGLIEAAASVDPDDYGGEDDADYRRNVHSAIRDELDNIDDEDFKASLAKDSPTGEPTRIERVLMEMGWTLEAIRQRDVQRALGEDEMGTVDDFDSEEEYVQAAVEAALDVLNE